VGWLDLPKFPSMRLGRTMLSVAAISDGAMVIPKSCLQATTNNVANSSSEKLRSDYPEFS
jgi:hypothetical protein